jgi:sterol desaturase/sphingolipid hydroxylase (fatty acid hydroxylase superfamily)
MPLKYVQIAVLGLVFGLQFLFEHLFPQNRKYNNWQNERFNIAIGVLNVLLVLIPAGVLVNWLEFIEQKNFGLLNQVQLPYVLYVVVVILVMDAWMYAWHRMNHTIPLLWKFHRFHHKDAHMNSTTALRFHFAELLFSYPGKALVCFLAGIDYTSLLVYETIFFASVVFHHSNIFISDKADDRYKRLLVSPKMHRIHHSRRHEETNSNFGALFSFWDKLFGSWKAKPKGEIIFGVETQDR